MISDEGKPIAVISQSHIVKVKRATFEHFQAKSRREEETEEEKERVREGEEERD